MIYTGVKVYNKFCVVVGVDAVSKITMTKKLISCSASPRAKQECTNEFTSNFDEIGVDDWRNT